MAHLDGLDLRFVLTLCGRAAVIYHLDWLEALLPRHVTNIDGELGLAVGKRSQFLTMWTYPWGCLRVLTTRRLDSPRVSHPRDSKSKPQCLL